MMASSSVLYCKHERLYVKTNPLCYYLLWLQCIEG